MVEKAKTPAIRFKGFTDDWEQRKAIDIADYSKGSGYSKSDLTEVGTPIILYGRLYTNYQFYIDEVDTFTISKNNSVFSQGNEVIIPASGETSEDIARASAVEISGVLLGGDLNILRPFNFLNPLFLALEISSGEAQKQLANKAQGKSVVHVRNTDIQMVSVSFPMKTEQDQIVAFFRSLDHLITLHQRKLLKLQNIKKAMLEKMFPKNGSDVPEVRFAGFTDAWEQRKFSDLVTRNSVMAVSSYELPGVEYEDIVSGQGILNKDIREKEHIKNGIRFVPNDILFGKLRPYLKNWILPDFSGVAVGDFWVLHPSDADSRYLYYLIQTPRFQTSANQSTGTKMPRSDWNLVSEKEFFLPNDINIQRKIGAVLYSIDHLITLHQRKLEKLKNIKKACLEKMFV